MELDRLIKQARSLLEQSEYRSDNKHIKFLDTLEHFLHKRREKFHISEAQLKYLCGLAKVNPDRYVFIDIH